MYRLTVNDHVMIAHSLPDEFFGPAQGMHGATLAVEATFSRPGLTEHGVVLDIGQASQLLDEALAPLRYANLDEHPDFAGRLTTTEVIAAYIGDRLATVLAKQPEIGITVSIAENPRASVSYTVTDRV